MKKGLLWIAALIMPVFLAGCASSLSADAYSRDQARQGQTVQYGTVQNIRTVQIEGTKSHVGTVGGAVVGGILGSTVGGGTGRQLATVGGAIAGGVAGSAAEEGITRQPGYEIEVRLDDGRMVNVVQAADRQFSPGQRVRVVRAPDGTTRVTP